MPKQPLSAAHLRVARPSDNLEALRKFYCDGLGFTVLGEFQDHDGFDGVMLGHAGAPYHLEFTHKCGHTAGKATSEEHLLVFYLPNENEWRAAVERMERCGFENVKAYNPYWDQRGKTYCDPDGYRVVLQNGSWPT